MIKAVLLDLDDTLLLNADRTFVPSYLRLLDQFIQQRWGYAQFSHVLRRFTRAAASLRDVRLTNMALAESIITDATGRDLADLVTTFNEFYTDVYPTLRGCVEAVKISPLLFENLRSQGYAVVIATNPLYPAEAIRQRIEWAGLPGDLSQYALVTHSENIHFVKPDPAYYAEIVARVGIEPDEALMIGDSLTNDMGPASLLGLHTFCITDDTSLEGSEGIDGIGSLEDFYQMTLQEGWSDLLRSQPPKAEAIEPQYRGNLGALFGLLADVQPQHWHQHPDPNEWSIIEVVCHLLWSEDAVQRPRLERILAEDNPFLVASPPPPGPNAQPPCADDGYHAAERFMERRQHTMRWLNQLEPEDWQRPARHSIFGPTTLLEMAHFTAQHDRLHINQICQTLGRCKDT